MIDCFSQGTSYLIVKFSKLTGQVNEGTILSFTVLNILNPPSTKPSSIFSDIYFYTTKGGVDYEIARYRKNDSYV
jgi:hypothetical protein